MFSFSSTSTYRNTIATTTHPLFPARPGARDKPVKDGGKKVEDEFPRPNG